MEITKVDLKILMKEFLSASNRILRADIDNYASELMKFVNFLESRTLIYDYIKSCGEPEYDVEKEVKEIEQAYGRLIFSLGTTEENEVANIYAVVKYLAINNYSGRSWIFYGYSSSRKYQDNLDAFGDKFLRIMITHIENYLTKIGIKMGLDDKTTVNLYIENSKVSNTQLNVATDGGIINTTQNNCNIEELDKLIAILREQSKKLPEKDMETVNDCIETIETLKTDRPKKGIIRTALMTLKGIAGTVEFVAAVTAVVEFVLNSL